MHNGFNQFEFALNLIRLNIPSVLVILGLIWLVQLLNWLLGYRLNMFGILPRSLSGLIGIICAPFLHANFNHIFFNSVALFVLMSFVLLSGWSNFICITIMIVFLSGLAIWLLGRKAIHIGASSVIMGYWGYLLINAYYKPGITAYVIVGISLYYFGGLLFSIFPAEGRSSWEGHLCGLFAGITSEYLCPLIQNYLHIY